MLKASRPHKPVCCFASYLNLFHVSQPHKVNLTLDDIKEAGGKQITTVHLPLDSKNLRDIASLTIFVESNIGGGEVTEINTIRFAGLAKKSMNLAD